MNGLRLNTVAIKRISMGITSPWREKDGGPGDTWDWPVQTGRKWRESRQRDTMKCCGVSICDCQMKREEQTHNEVIVFLVEVLCLRMNSHSLVHFPPCSQKTWFCPRKRIFRFSCHGSLFNHWVFFGTVKSSCLQQHLQWKWQTLKRGFHRVGTGPGDNFRHAQAHYIYTCKIQKGGFWGHCKEGLPLD